MSFTTGQLAEYVCGDLVGSDAIACCGAEIDTRAPLKGKVFFALKGTQQDGHEFVGMAEENGCAAVVVQRPCNVTVPAIIVTDVKYALMQLARERRAAMQLEAVIAVTGSVGKTTTKDFIASLLGDSAVASRKSFNNDLGVPLTILDGEQAAFLVAEIGASNIGEIEPLSKLVRPDIAILTSIEKAHLDGFGDQKTVLHEKAKLLQSVQSDGIVVVPDTVDLSKITLEARTITVGKKNAADVRIDTAIDSNGFAMLTIEGTTIKLSMLGEHNAMNAALAFVAAKHANPEIATETLLDRASSVCAAQGRLCKKEVGGVVFLDDSYNANPASMRSAMGLFSTLEASRKVLVLGDMLDLGDSSHAEHRLLGPVIQKVGADLVILVGEAMQEALGTVAAISVSSTEELDGIHSLLKPNDFVLLKGSRGLQLERIIDSFRNAKVLEH
ncbi:MAG: UDP-N-acetylmuramoyl-tripeptide--D-alanyl-D-alanine ligase [Planctomycetes bacterium]|nr:UDP-N-acetylmuramoyl-tripeptide--D-alanyl-D-alanine ligase [Planctomycetota bacterium]